MLDRPITLICSAAQRLYKHFGMLDYAITQARMPTWALNSPDDPVTSRSGAVRVQSGGKNETELLIEAALAAAELVRVAQKQAYAERGRSMVASDMLHALHNAVASSWPLKEA